MLSIDHLYVTLFVESHDDLPDVNLGDLAVEDDLPHNRLDVPVKVLVRGLTPSEALCHIVARAEWESSHDYLLQVDQGLEDLDGSHDTAITTHEGYDDLSFLAKAHDCVADEVVASLRLVLVKHIKDVSVYFNTTFGICNLEVASTTKELGSMLIATTRISDKEHIVSVHLY